MATDSDSCFFECGDVREDRAGAGKGEERRWTAETKRAGGQEATDRDAEEDDG